MRDIYARASEVLILLGGFEEDSEPLLKFMAELRYDFKQMRNYAQLLDKYGLKFHVHQHGVYWNKLERPLSQPWFSRV
jgi:hypothetical protein